MNEKQRILLVDDNQEFCKTMTKMFERSGYDVTVAGNGEEALDRLDEHAVDLIISDLRMPGLDGIGLMEEIKRKRIRTPIIFLTAYGEVESYMDLMNLGAFEYINKPADVKDIMRAVNAALEECGKIHS